VDIVDLKSRQKVVLRSGEYHLGLAGDPPGLRIDATDPLELRRGDKKIVQVRRLPAKPELLHRIAWQDVEQNVAANIWRTEISADGKLFFGAGDGGPTGSIRIFEVATGKLVHDLRPGPDVWFSHPAFVPGGKYLAAGYALSGDIYLWDLATGKVVRKFTGHTGRGVALAVSPDGRRLLSWSEDRTLRLWEVETGRELRKLAAPAVGASGVFSPDGKKVLTFGDDGILRLWETDTGKPLLRLEGHTAPCTGTFSPDGKQVLSFSPDRTIRLWDLETGKEVRRFNGPRGKEGTAGFVAGGCRVVAYCDDQKFHVWETESGKVLQEIDLAEMSGSRNSMTASPDGRLGLVYADLGPGSVRVFDLTTGKEIHRYTGCRSVGAFAFSPDGNFAVAGSFRAGMYVFRLPGKQGKP
jgi:WD40 repeat protein